MKQQMKLDTVPSSKAVKRGERMFNWREVLGKGFLFSLHYVLLLLPLLLIVPRASAITHEGDIQDNGATVGIYVRNGSNNVMQQIRQDFLNASTSATVGRGSRTYDAYAEIDSLGLNSGNEVVEIMIELKVLS